ncbi:MAG: COX15/CtaA family protein [Sphingomonadales bacterium]
MAGTSFILTDNRNERAIGIWLLIMAFMVFLMVVVGGATRLTESGLSMVHWQPLSGVVPPLSEADWQAEFAAYQAFPQYQTVNRGMSLPEFKTIFWWEYGHRLLGRLIGLAFALPLLFFLARGRVRRQLKMTLFFLLALGGSQGLLGWYMVQSGLIDQPAVSQYRLAAHLLLALAIFAALLWVALGLLRPGRGQDDPRVRRLTLAIFGLVFLQSFLGALVAGLDAGRAYNTWPAMDGGFMPELMFDLSPWWLNFFENIAAVQFDHRLAAYLLVGLSAYLLYVALKSKAPRDLRRGAGLLLGLLMAQMTLGIAALLNFVPVGLGTAHQAGGVLVLGLSLYLVFETKAPAASS